MNANTGLSVVVPVFNEEGNVIPLAEEIRDELEKLGLDYEIIFVDDGSTDDTFALLNNLEFIKLKRLRINEGQTKALRIGIDSARFSYIILMDGDRQNDPKDIKHLYEKIRESQLDCIVGWRKVRQDSFLKRLTSKGAMFLRQRIIPDDIHDAGCTLKIINAEAAKNLELFGELHRFIPSMLLMKGYQIGEVVVNHRPRVAGKTKYNWRRTVKGYLDMVGLWFWNGYKTRPLHLFGSLGILFILLGLGAIMTAILFYFTANSEFTKILPVVSAAFTLSGIQLIVSGLISDYMTRNFISIKEKLDKI